MLLLLCTKQEWIGKFVETKNTSTQTKKSWPLVKKKTSALINIAQENDSNIFELLQNLWIYNLRFVILNVLDFVYLLLLFLFYFYCIPKCSWYCSFHGYKREEKSNLKANTPGFKNFQFFPTTPRTISFRCFFQPPLLFHPPSIRGLRVRYKGNHSPSYWKIECLWARCCIEKPQNFSKVTRKVIFKLCLSLRI